MKNKKQTFRSHKNDLIKCFILLDLGCLMEEEEGGNLSGEKWNQGKIMKTTLKWLCGLEGFSNVSIIFFPK